MVITGNQQLIKTVNRLAIVRQVRTQPGLSRSELAAAVQLTKSTVGQLVEGLIADGWLTESEMLITGHAGRRPTPLALDKSRKLLVGASINGDHSEVAATNLNCELRELTVADAKGTLDAVLDVLARQLADLHDKASDMGQEISAIGLGVPGPVDAERGILRYSAKTGWTDAPIREMLQQRLVRFGMPGIPVIVERAVACIALHHFEYERTEGDGHLLYVQVGSGVAACIVNDGRILRGHNGLAGAIAHQPVQPGGPLCSCGQYGCADAVVSRTAMERDFGDDIARLRVAVQEGDPRAKAILQRTGSGLGQLLFNLCLQLSPARLFVGGPAFQVSNDYLHAAQDTLEQLCIAVSVPVPRLQVVRFEQRNVALGACAAALQSLLSCPASGH